MLPVLVSSGSSTCEVRTYAMLDSQSDTSFVSSGLVSDLGISGTRTVLSLTTMGGLDQVVTCRKVRGLRVRRADSADGPTITVDAAFSRDCIPCSADHIPGPDRLGSWEHLQFLGSKLLPVPELPVCGLLVGFDCSEALRPLRVVSGPPGAPFAIETPLGWSVVGCLSASQVCASDSQHVFLCSAAAVSSRPSRSALVLRSSASELVTPLQVSNLLEQGFTAETGDAAYSQDDLRFLRILDSKTVFIGDRFHIPLPFASDVVDLPDNRFLALHRAKSLRSRLLSDSVTRERYCNFMQEMFDAGYAEPVPEGSLVPGKCYFLSHHGVYSPSNPTKLRVVFDASARCKGVSLNDQLLSGPDLNNSLVGVLVRFRKEHVAIVCDVKKMFMQFKVLAEHRDFLCFWWWEGSRFEESPRIFRMSSHVFGAKSSPSCAAYGLRRVAEDFGSQYGEEVSRCVKENFYVDDALCSVDTVSGAVQLVSEMSELLSKASLGLHKFVSNSPTVCQQLQVEHQVESLDVPGASGLQKALGVRWCTVTDTFQFTVNTELKKNLASRRNILSMVSGIFDPLGFISPYVLEGRNILQAMCKSGIDWDEVLPAELESRYARWVKSLDHLVQVRVPRCYKPEGFGEVSVMELHVFGDASLTGIGVAAYLRLVNTVGIVHCSLVAAKSRVVPSKTPTVPRLELMAAVLAAKVGSKLKAELGYGGLPVFYWSDSLVTLGYIRNKSKRFHVFVANRVEQIRELTDPSDWFHVDTKSNPADLASRGLDASQISQHSCWFEGPAFLWQQSLDAMLTPPVAPVSDSDSEVKSCSSFATVAVPTFDLSRFQHISSWEKLVKVVALVLKLKSQLLLKVRNTCSSGSGFGSSAAPPPLWRWWWR